ncbi:hypothetical protein [Kitasatospora purpeofusca]|uniref:Transposase n=1 Tax=Kitasatospora purpeofusca TaxID=67352 RepID=A0ABZ1TZJ6_9ACTN|nr:hypothetical protein [Kitasatospora purpeofusca]
MDAKHHGCGEFPSGLGRDGIDRLETLVRNRLKRLQYRPGIIDNLQPAPA